MYLENLGDRYVQVAILLALVCIKKRFLICLRLAALENARHVCMCTQASGWRSVSSSNPLHCTSKTVSHWSWSSVARLAGQQAPVSLSITRAEITDLDHCIWLDVQVPGNQAQSLLRSKHCTDWAISPALSLMQENNAVEEYTMPVSEISGEKNSTQIWPNI